MHRLTRIILYIIIIILVLCGIMAYPIYYLTRNSSNSSSIQSTISILPPPPPGGKLVSPRITIGLVPQNSSTLNLTPFNNPFIPIKPNTNYQLNIIMSPFNSNTPITIVKSNLQITDDKGIKYNFYLNPIQSNGASNLYFQSIMIFKTPANLISTNAQLNLTLSSDTSYLSTVATTQTILELYEMPS